MDNFFVSEFQYTEECIPEYLKRWWRENLIVSYILTALVFLYFFLMLIIRRNLVYLFLELLPILLLLLIGSALMVCLGILGYYIAKIYEEIKDRPRYIVADDCGGNQNHER